MAQEVAKQAGKGPTLEELNASYSRQLRELDHRRITDLVALTSRTNGPEADAAYATLFHLAIAGGFCSEAESAADAASPPRAWDASLAPWPRSCGFSQRPRRATTARLSPRSRGSSRPRDDDDKGVNGDTALAVGEAYLQRLIRDGRYDLARELCECACDEDDAPASLKEHFEARMDRLKLLGKDAPPDLRGRCRRQGGLPCRPQGQGRPDQLLGDLVPAVRRRNPQAERPRRKVPRPGFRGHGDQR